MFRQKSIALLLALVLLLSLPGCQSKSDTPDYAQAENWAVLETEQEKEADVFFIAPTVYGGSAQQLQMPLDDEASKENFCGAIAMEQGIYDGDCRVFAPYYRQVGLNVYTLPQEEQEPYLSLAYQDVKEAFLYYLDRSPDTSGTTVITITGETETETRPSVLYRMNPDGSGREQIYTFDDNATVEDVAFGGPGGLYFVTKKLGTAQISSGTYTTASDRQLICLDPSSRETRAVCPLDFDDGLNWQVIGCAGNQIILETYQYPDGMTEQDAAALDEDSYMDILKKTKLVYAIL